MLLPQILLNARRRSAGGLTPPFLGLWIAGDASNLAGAVLTRQAAWQVGLGAYYLCVDCTLLAQWAWFEGLARGRATAARGRTGVAPDGFAGEEGEGLLLEERAGFREDEDAGADGASSADAEFPRTSDSDAEPASPGLHRRRSSGIGKVSLQAAVVGASMMRTANALLHDRRERGPALLERSETSVAIGRIFSWPPYVLFIASRFPIIYGNYKRRSTAGLSPFLFLGCFVGNFLYLMGLMFDPRAWEDLAPYGAGGWVGSEGSIRAEWLGLSAPYLLGSMVLTCLDTLVGWQFWTYRRNTVGLTK